MKPIALITSVPPRMARRTGDGRDLGEQYGPECIATWTQCGFTPISVNARAELKGRATIAEGVIQVAVDHDASSVTGKPHVYLRDLVRTAREHGPGPVAIANADILLDPAAGLRETVGALGPGEMLVAKRVDVASPDERGGSEYGDGFDFFAAHAGDFAGLEESNLIFGAPWWDHYLPLRMLARRTKLVFAPRPFAFHLLHDQRWSWEVWQAMGECFLEEMRAALPSGDDPADEVAREYARRLDLALRSRESEGMAETIRGFVRAPWSSGRYRKLRRVSAANIRFLDDVRARP
jgi:hypothetical protein